MDIQAGFIKYALIIVAILVVVFLGQQAFFKGAGERIISGASNQIRTFMAKGSDWAASATLPLISGGVEKGKEAISSATSEVNEQKEKISETVTEKITNYFSGVANSIMGKTNPPACPCPALDAETSP